MIHSSTTEPRIAAEHGRKYTRQNSLQRCCGFTLIEVLVAVTISSLVLTGVYGIFTRVSTAEREIRARAECYHHARSIFNRLGKEIGAAILLADVPESEFKTAEYGELTFTSTSVPGADGSISLQQVHYRVQAREQAADENETLKLQRYSTALFSPQDEPQWRRLSSKVVELQWRFHDGTEWNDSWDSHLRKALPQTVELRLILSCSGHRVESVTAFDLFMAGSS